MPFRRTRRAAPGPFSLRRLPGFTVIALVCFVMLYAPILTLVVYSFNAGKSIADLEGFSWRWYVVGLGERTGPGGDPVSLILVATARRPSRPSSPPWPRSAPRGPPPFRGQTAIYAMINQPLMVPEIVTAVALLIVFAAIKTCDRLSRAWPI